ncbi:MAG: hypothetical protein ACKVJ7_04460 [Candidatus Poseidoniales archaeon]
MISAGTFHVITTELVVGMFALAGIAYLLLVLDKKRETADIVAHWAMLGGLLALPLTIIFGIYANPTEQISNQLLANKVLLSFSALGISVGVLLNRWLNKGPISDRLHPSIGMVACGMILLVASLGGMYTRGESLLFFLPKDIVLIFPVWASTILLLMGLMLISKSAVDHRRG